MQCTRAHAKWYLLGAIFVTNLFIWSAIFAEERGGFLTVAFLDVGQGDAIFIEAPNGNQMLIDGGPGRAVFQPLSEMMPFYDRSIDAVIATHPDADHIGGLPEVLRRYEIGLFIDPGMESDTGVYQALVQAVKSSDVRYMVARRGMRIALDEEKNIFLEILFPDRDMTGADTNDASVVAKLVYGKTSFLLTGDSPQKIEKYLASIDAGNLDIDVLKLGHHGSKTSSSAIFLGYTSPEYAIISAGKDNRYGHPHEEVLARLREFGITNALRTDEEGTIVMKSDGETIFAGQ